MSERSLARLGILRLLSFFVVVCSYAQSNSHTIICNSPAFSDSFDSSSKLYLRSSDSYFEVWEFEVPPTPFNSLKPAETNESFSNSNPVMEWLEINTGEGVSRTYLKWSKAVPFLSAFWKHKERKDMEQEADRQRLIVQFDERYRNLHMSLQRFDFERFIHPELQAVIKNSRFAIRKYLEENQGLFAARNDAGFKIDRHYRPQATAFYIPRIFSDEFLTLLNEELQHAEKGVKEGKWKLRRPNTMNRFGFVLEELKLDSFLTEFREQVLEPLSAVAYPEYGGGSLDSHFAFTVRYRQDEDVKLDRHMDLSEITLNVNIQRSSDAVGGELVVEKQWGDANSIEPTVFPQPFNSGILHPGTTYHEARPLQRGERQNLIFWGRSTSYRSSPSENYVRYCEYEKDEL